MFYVDPVETALTALSTAMSLLRAPLWSIQVLCSLAAAAVGISTAGSTSGGLLASAEGVYNSSITPSDLPWNTYNYCNAPHVNAARYAKPTNASRAELVYLNAVIRHHKVRGEDAGAPLPLARSGLIHACVSFTEDPGQPVPSGERAQRSPLGLHGLPAVQLWNERFPAYLPPDSQPLLAPLPLTDLERDV